MQSAVRNLTELLGVLSEEIRRHGAKNVEVLCPLKASFKKGARKKLQALLVAVNAPIKKPVLPAPGRIRPFSKRGLKSLLAGSAGVAVVPPACLAV